LFPSSEDFVPSFKASSELKPFYNSKLPAHTHFPFTSNYKCSKASIIRIGTEEFRFIRIFR